MATNFLTKQAQIISYFLAVLKFYLLSKTVCGYFWATLGSNWASFYVNIMLHWSENDKNNVKLNSQITKKLHNCKKSPNMLTFFKGPFLLLFCCFGTKLLTTTLP